LSSKGAKLGLIQKSKKILAALLSLIAFITALFLYLGHFHYKLILEYVVGSEQEIATKIYSNTFALVTDHYEAVAYSLLMRDDIIDAFDKRDRETLSKLTIPLFKQMHEQNPYMDIMHFHMPDSSSFLRVHEPKKYGDDLSSFRFIVNDVNKYQKKMIGMEVGRYGIDYRVVMPVFNKKNEHIGSFEFGLNMKYIYDILKKDYGIENILLVNRSIFPIIHRKNKNLKFEVFSDKYYLLNSDKTALMDQLPKNVLNEKYMFIEENDVSYMVYPVTLLKDVRGQEIGQIVFVKNMEEYTSAIELIRIISLGLGILLIAVSYYLMKSIFSRYTNTIEHYQYQLERKNQTLSKMTNIDFLTKISNRRHIQNILVQEIKRSKRYNNKLSLIIFDVDDFKQINDKYGHNVGDAVLQNIAQVMSNQTRQSDYIGRWGGEEFIVVATETAVENASVLAEELRTSIEQFDFHEEFRVTCSFGLIELTDENDVSEIVNKADHAMYRAKKNGKNRIAVYDPEFDNRTHV